MDREEYDFQVDAQADKLVELKQKLVYFLVSAATAVVAFSAKFALDYSKGHPNALAPGGAVKWLVVSALAALVSSACALISIHLGHKSYETHIEYRYLRQTPDDTERGKWDKLTTGQLRLLWLSSLCLIVSTSFAFFYFAFLLW